MIDDVKCPYCGTDQEINHDDGHGYEEWVLNNQQCAKCDKYFVFTTSISYYYDVAKADCLNDGEHNFKPTVTYPKCCTRLECVTCGELKDLSPDDEIIKSCDCSICKEKNK